MANVISGQITVATAGTAVAGPSTNILPGLYMFSGNPGNTGTAVYIGNDGNDDVTSANGMTLGTGDFAFVVIGLNLAEMYFDADTNGDKIDWLRVSGPPEGAPPSI